MVGQLYRFLLWIAATDEMGSESLRFVKFCGSLAGVFWALLFELPPKLLFLLALLIYIVYGKIIEAWNFY